MTGQKALLRGSLIATLAAMPVALLLGQAATPARAAVPAVTLTADSDLHFGTFMVFGTGSRTVSASGAVTDRGVVPIEARAPAPARFTISYDRGNENKHVLDLEFELVMSPPPPVRQGGVEARLHGYETDLPGAARIDPGRAVRVTIPGCRTRVCTRSFQVGARLDVTRQFGGAEIVVPIPMDVTVISAERQR
jgi:hypothetical protein